MRYFNLFMLKNQEIGCIFIALKEVKSVYMLNSKQITLSQNSRYELQVAVSCIVLVVVD